MCWAGRGPRARTSPTRQCRFLAYPFGEENERVREAARRAGYEAAFGLVARASTRFSRYAIPRVDLYRNDARSRVGLKTSPLRYLRSIVRRRRLGYTLTPI
jgi:hypothetical protein